MYLCLCLLVMQKWQWTIRGVRKVRRSTWWEPIPRWWRVAPFPFPLFTLRNINSVYIWYVTYVTNVTYSNYYIHYIIYTVLNTSLQLRAIIFVEYFLKEMFDRIFLHIQEFAFNSKIFFILFMAFNHINGFINPNVPLLNILWRINYRFFHCMNKFLSCQYETYFLLRRLTVFSLYYANIICNLYCKLDSRALWRDEFGSPIKWETA